MPENPGPPTYRTLTEALDTHTVDELKKLLTHFYKLTKPARKSEVIAMIEEQFDGAGLSAIWLRLSDLQKAAIAEVVHSTGYHHDAARFAAKYGSAPQWSIETNSGKTYGHVRNFSILNVFFINYSMPMDLKMRLKDFVPEPQRTVLKTLDNIPDLEVPAVIQQTAPYALEDVVSVLRLVDAGKVAVSDKTRLPSGATTREIAALLNDGEYYSSPRTIDDEEYNDTAFGPIKAFAWPLILQAGGLAELSGKKLRLTTAGQKALTAPPADVLRSLWKKWQSATIVDELRRIDIVKGQTGRGQHGLTSPSRRRNAIVQALSHAPVGQWVDIDDFYRFTIAAGFGFDVTRDPWSLYVFEQEYGSFGYDGHEGVLDISYLLCFLFEYAATLGLIDVAYVPPECGLRYYGDMWGTDDIDFFSRYDGLVYFRLNALGAYCLGQTPTFTPAPLPFDNQPALQIHRNHEIELVGERLSSGDLLLLDTYAHRISDTAWLLNIEKLLGVMESGKDVNTLREFLAARTCLELPDSVSKMFGEVESRGRMLSHVGPARLIVCSEKDVARLIAGDSHTRKLCRLCGDSHLVVMEDQIAAFRRAVQGLGYVLPALPGS